MRSKLAVLGEYQVLLGASKAIAALAAESRYLEAGQAFQQARRLFVRLGSSGEVVGACWKHVQCTVDGLKEHVVRCLRAAASSGAGDGVAFLLKYVPP